jgi:hypothetical protein
MPQMRSKTPTKIRKGSVATPAKLGSTSLLGVKEGD